MSLDKAIEHGKERRKKYRGAKAVSCQCRNHGLCDWCKANRTKDTIVNDIKYEDAMKEYENDNIIK